MKIPEDFLPIEKTHKYNSSIPIGANNGEIFFDEEIDYLVKSANNFPEAIKILKTIREDSEKALNGDWDRSDSGFESQLILIDEFLNKIEE